MICFQSDDGHELLFVSELLAKIKLQNTKKPQPTEQRPFFRYLYIKH